MPVPEWVKLLPEIIVALGTVALAFYTAYLYRETERLRREAAKTREEDKKPNIIISIEPHKIHVNIMMLVIENVGKGPAYSLNTKLTNDFAIKNSMEKQISSLGILHLPILKAGQKVSSMLGMYGEVKEYKSEATTICKNVDGMQYSFKSILDAASYLGQISVGNDPLHEIVKHLEEIKRSLSMKRLQVDVHNSEDREAEEDDRRSWVAEHQQQK